MKHTFFLFIALTLALVSCKKKEVSFTYSPETPRAGQQVKFTNNTEEGEEWLWTFGDISTSTSKSPVKTYQKPGTYTVVLKVDDNKRYTYSATITVIDTVPAIGVSDSIVYYYQAVTLSADAYNPTGHTCTYQWTLPESTILLDGELTDKSIKVAFTRTGVTEHVSCDFTIGSKNYQLKRDIPVEDYPARALILARGNQLYHQRLYALDNDSIGVEADIAYPLSAALLTAPQSLFCADGQLYIFNADASAEGRLIGYDLDTHTPVTFVSNAVAADGQGFFAGYYSTNMLYWSSRDAVWASSASNTGVLWDASSSALLVKTAAELGLPAGEQSHGLVFYNNAYLWAYGDGITRFTTAGDVATILKGHSIRCFALDRIAQKIYFVDAAGLSVCNLNGSAISLIDAQANGKAVTIDQSGNRFCWTTNDGVFGAQLVQSTNNSHSIRPYRINSLSGISALAVDEIAR